MGRKKIREEDLSAGALHLGDDFTRCCNGILGREDRPPDNDVVDAGLDRVGGSHHPLLIIPPGVWHGLQNVGNSEALVLNFPTRAYNYEDPDHYRLPFDTAEIPYRWTISDRPNRLRSNGGKHGES